MDRPVKAGEEFTTFVFDGKDCADMGIYSITNSGTYTLQLEPVFKDEGLEVPAYDGKYYYGTQYTVQQFQYTMFADNLSLQEYQNLKMWLSPKKVGKLITAEQPYKYYIVKVTSIGTLGQYPLTDIQTPENSVLGDWLEGNIVYTGKFTVTFQTVGSVYGYGLSYFRDDLIYDAKHHYLDGRYEDYYYYDSGLLYKDMAPALSWNITRNNEEIKIPMYNPGTAVAEPIFTINSETTIPSGGMVCLENKATQETMWVDLSGFQGEIIIDLSEEYVKANDILYFNRISGDAFTISPETDVIEIPDRLVQTIEHDYFREYDTFYINTVGSDKIVSLNPLALEVNEKWKDVYYFCTNHNGGALITDVNLETNEFTLDPNVTTYDIPEATSGRPAGFECNYLGTYNDINDIEDTATRALGNVARTEDNIWYIYRYNKWEETNLFDSENEFKDAIGNRIPRYLVFGATIVKMDDIVITATNMPSFTLSAELLPRYI